MSDFHTRQADTTGPSTAPQALNGLRVLDCSQGIAGPFCARLLGDLGADVVKLEPPEGDRARRLGPFPDGTPDPERSATYFCLNASKRGIVVDLATASGRAQLGRLVRQYDIVIADGTRDDLAARGITYDALCEHNPAVILTTISGFGASGPRAHWQSTHIVNGAVGGWTTVCGTPDREPLQCGGALTETLTGAMAAVATVQAAYGRRVHGRGEYIDVSEQEATYCGSHLLTLAWEYRGIVPGRYSSVGAGAGASYMLPTETGTIGLNALTPAQWHQLCAFLGREDIATDPRLATISWATPDERLEEVREAFRAALAGRTAEELFHAAQVARVPFGLVPDLAGMLTLPPHVERGFFRTVHHPVAGDVAIPGVPFHTPEMQLAPTRPPLLGEHTQAVLAALPDEVDSGNATAAGAGATADDSTCEPGAQPLPLAGLRIVDLSMFFAGPVCAQLMADAGADVIKVESIQRIDGWRGSAMVSDAEAPGWESSYYFNWVNRNKRGITLNLKDPRGVEAVKALIRDADAVIENFTPRVLAGFGLDWATLHALNPRLVLISLSGYGQTTSWRDYVAFGMSTEEMSGAAHLTGYADGGPMFTGMTGGDLLAGVIGANALMAALHHARSTGRGQHLDLSQIEACALYFGDALTGWTLAGHDPGRTGNRHPMYAPHGIYPCGGAGGRGSGSDGSGTNDRWIAIACRTDDEWQRLTTEMGRTDLDVPELADAACRRARADEIDAAIAAWTAAHADPIALMERLQEAGIPAGAVMNGPELLADPQFRARGMLFAQDRPGIGVRHYPRQPWVLRNARPPEATRAPLLGEHTVDVLTGELGMDDDAIAELVIDDVIGTEPIAART